VSGIFNSFIFNNQVFNTGTAGPTPPPVVIDDAKSGGGGIEEGGVYKPTGLTRRKKLKLKKHDERIEEFKDAQIEIAARLAREFSTDVPRGTFKPISQMSMLDVDREIGELLRQKIRTEEDEMLLLLLMAAAAE
jgi:hypothetical protein